MNNPLEPEPSIIARHEAIRLRARLLGGIHVEDVVLGANDGIITTFAVVAGATGGSLGTTAIIVLGLANLFADSISMGASNYLGKRSKADYVQSQRRMEEVEVEQAPHQEKEEIRRIFRDKGLEGETLETVVEAITRNKSTWVDVMMTEELGLMEDDSSPTKHGIATAVAFIVAGSIPLLPYLLDFTSSFPISVATAAVSLFVTGSLRTLITGVNWLRGGLEMLGVGAAAAVVAYVIGTLVSSVI